MREDWKGRSAVPGDRLDIVAGGAPRFRTSVMLAEQGWFRAEGYGYE